MTERIWAMLSDSKMYGRRGFETAALAPIDMALWDIKAKLAGLPLHRLVGGYRDRVPIYIAGGYYSSDKTLRDLQAEMTGDVEKGAKAVKMKVGRLSHVEDAARVGAVRAALGPDIKLMIDANCAYRAHEAIQFARRVEAFDIAGSRSRSGRRIMPGSQGSVCRRRSPSPQESRSTVSTAFAI